MLRSISLQNFRNYTKREFKFNKSTLIVGPNTTGKSNLLEAIFLISTGKSFRTDKDFQMLTFEKEIGRVKANLESLELEVVVTNGNVGGIKSQYKKFLINGVAKRRADFTGNLLTVLFSPKDIEIIIDSPSLRRNFLNNVLEQIDKDYRNANIAYVKAVRQRNALLEKTREEIGGRRPGEPVALREKQFEYWDNLVIENGQVITKKREQFLSFVNKQDKEILDFNIHYDKSLISRERLDQYKREELASGVTLVGPHRDDFSVFINNSKEAHDIRYFGSRGQQRLAILQLKALEMEYIENIKGQKPLLLLDDVFSELDQNHIELVLSMKNYDQIIITTTHKEFVKSKYLNSMEVFEL